MKKTLFALTIAAAITGCSSSRNAVTRPEGISNVQVNGTIIDSSALATAPRDWAYSSSRDTAISGNWQLAGMLIGDTTWKTADEWAPMDTTAVMADSTGLQQTGIIPPAVSSKKATSFAAALYDTTTSYIDTAATTIATALKPFVYWHRVPEMRINPALGVFTGNTGCNSMSGTFNFSGNEMKFNNRIRTSKMACNEYDESGFIQALTRVNNYTISNDLLELKEGDKVLMSFRRKS